MRARPVSTTVVMPGMVIEVSATLVATMTLAAPAGAGRRHGPARPRSGARRAAAPGSPERRPAAIASQVSRMSCSVGMKTRMSPARRSRRSRRTAATACSTGVASSSAGPPSGGCSAPPPGRSVPRPRSRARRRRPARTCRVDRGRGHDHPRSRRRCTSMRRIAQDEVDVEVALVGLVHDEGVVGREHGSPTASARRIPSVMTLT